jgi:2-dehydropantoate 2-reductase
MKTLVIGAGAVGGYFGARLTAAGRDVTFLVRAGRAEQLRRTGLQVTSPHDSFTVQPKLLLAEELKQTPQTFDLILISTKAYQLAAAMDDFAPAVGAPQTAILPLLNGMAHLDALVARFGEGPVLGGSTSASWRTSTPRASSTPWRRCMTCASASATRASRRARRPLRRTSPTPALMPSSRRTSSRPCGRSGPSSPRWAPSPARCAAASAR